MSSEAERGQFLLLHGFTGSGPEHWQSWLAQRLIGADHDVRYPALPNPDAPQVTQWIAALRGELARTDPDRLIVLAHSCGALLWLHVAASNRRRLAKRVLLVAPPGPRWHEPAATGFLPVPLHAAALQCTAEETRIVAAADDPCSSPAEAREYAHALGVELDLLQSGGHLNTSAGFGPWPAVERWARGNARAVT
jgi:uncharacterized protein